MHFDRPGIQTTMLETEAIEMAGRSVLILAERITYTALHNKHYDRLLFGMLGIILLDGYTCNQGAHG
jgi:hypothetical protein